MEIVDYGVGNSGDNIESELEMRHNLVMEVESEGGDQHLRSNSNSTVFIYYPQVPEEVKPKQGQEFKTLDDVHSFYNTYAKQAGFSVRKWSEKKKQGSNVVTRKEYVCYKQGKGTIIADPNVKRALGVVKEGCDAKIAVVRSTNDTYIITLFDEGHNHSLSTPSKTHLLRSHRSLTSAQKCLTQQLSAVNIPTHQQFNLIGLQAGGFENIGCTQQDLYNYERDMWKEMKGHDGDMFHEYLKLEKVKNPLFTFEIKSDVNQRITHCFWADATSRRAYKFYGDVVIFDTTYNTNRYGLIFAPLMGVNNHSQTIIFGCAFLGDETVDSFVWLFNQFLEAMPGEAPKMIIIDQDPAMTKAISKTLPNTFHRYCSWHILTKFSEKIDSVKYNAYYNEFSDCIWKTEVKEEFDFKWIELIGRSGLNDNKWLQTMFDMRSTWVPCYVNYVFSAGMSSSQRAESDHAFFKGFVSKKNSLVDSMIQFGRGLLRQRHEEKILDHKDLTEKPKMKLQNDVLVQMVDIYTREAFHKFQDEMWACSNYKFEHVMDDGNKNVYKIKRKNFESYKFREIVYDKELNFATCTCKMFESSGIPCRHILSYLQKYHDFEEIPSQYILKRWTKTAKVGEVIVEGDMEINDEKSYFINRSRLIQYALNMVDKALTNQETMNAYIDALDGANEKINQIIGGVRVDEGRTNPMVGGGPSVVSSGRMSCNYEHSYNEPNQVRVKGCGKRLKGGKEKALKKAKKSKARRCNACGLVGQSHDKRNCPMLVNRSSQHNEEATPNASLEDDEDYSTEGLSNEEYKIAEL